MVWGEVIEMHHEEGLWQIEVMPGHTARKANILDQNTITCQLESMLNQITFICQLYYTIIRLFADYVR